MELELDTAGLSELLGSFYDVAGVSTGVFHPDGKRMFGKAGQDCKFCSLVKKHPFSVQRCRENDMDAFRRAMNGEQWIYRWRAGLIEAVAPIHCRQQPVTCLMIGQAAPKEEEKKQNKEHAPRQKRRVFFGVRPCRTGHGTGDFGYSGGT